MPRDIADKHLAADLRAAIEAALRRLPARPDMPSADRETLLASAVQLYLNMAEARRRLPETPPRHEHVGRAQARRELNEVAKHCEAEARVLEGLHAETVAALADVGWLQPGDTAPQLRRLAALARAADVSAVPRQPATRPKQHFVHAIATKAAADYGVLTGRAPTITTRKDRLRSASAGGPFVELLAALFAAFEVGASVESAARDAVRRWRRGAPPPGPGALAEPAGIGPLPDNPRGGKAWGTPNEPGGAIDADGIYLPKKRG